MNVRSRITNRTDHWWFLPILMLIAGLGALGYLTWAALVGAFYTWGPYVSPIYAAPWVPGWWKISPALLLLWIPAGFRITCYYSRKTYHRVAFGSPIACGVEEPYRKQYTGETKLPFVLNNLHRVFLYFALVLLALHWIEWILSLFHEGSIYVGLGTLIILIDTVSLTFYVFGCHALRHLVGGGARSFSCGTLGGTMALRARKRFASYRMWKTATVFNTFHNVWFWVSLFSIGVADLYVRLLAMGIIQNDPHVLF